MTATEFSALATGWVGSIYAVLQYTLPKIAALEAQAKDLLAKHEQNAKGIAVNDARLDLHDQRADLPTKALATAVVTPMEVKA